MSTELHTLLEQSLPLKLKLSPLENAKAVNLLLLCACTYTVIIRFVQCALYTVYSNDPYEYNTLAKVATYQRH